MRKLYQQQFGSVPQAFQSIINEICRASQDGDIIDIGQGFTINNTSFTETRELNVTAPTIANVAAVLATLIADFKRGGATKST